MSQTLTFRRLFEPQTLLAIVTLPVLVWYGNPAVALLVGAALSLVFNKVVVPGAGVIGKQALQIAIVLLGLKLNAAQLVQISSDYSLLVTVYVGLTIGIGLLMGRWLGNQRKCSQLISSGTAICGGTHHCQLIASDRGPTRTDRRSAYPGFPVERPGALYLPYCWRSAVADTGAIWSLGRSGHPRHLLRGRHGSHLWR